MKHDLMSARPWLPESGTLTVRSCGPHLHLSRRRGRNETHDLIFQSGLCKATSLTTYSTQAPNRWRSMGTANSRLLDDIVQGSNCRFLLCSIFIPRRLCLTCPTHTLPTLPMRPMRRW